MKKTPLCLFAVSIVLILLSQRSSTPINDNPLVSTGRLSNTHPSEARSTSHTGGNYGTRAAKVPSNYSCCPLHIEDVIITGPATGVVHAGYTFTATTSPADASQPITYVWQASGQPEATTHTGKGLSDTVGFTWSVTGPQIITVTASNAANAVTATHPITIGASLPTSVTIIGPAAGVVYAGYAFTATVTPTTTTLPITYTWYASEQSTVTTTTPSLNDTIVFSWSVTGPQIITVTASNAVNTVTAIHPIAIGASLPTSVTITGPAAGVVYADCTFTATVTPTTTTLPITYIWQASEQSTVTTITHSLNNAIVFSWNTTGTQIITVTAMNIGGMISSPRHTTTVEWHKVHFPLVMRCSPYSDDSPVLDAITPPENSISYTVSWSAVVGTETYILEEATTSNFSDAKEIYTGPATSYAVTSRCIETYYYRVKARNTCVDKYSDWSNEEAVEVRWECESIPSNPHSNNSRAAAEGPLISGVDYFGFPNDGWDCFKFDVSADGEITASLTGHTGSGVCLYLVSKKINLLHQHCEPPYYFEIPVNRDDEHYVCIKTTSGFNSNTSYTLQVTFPTDSP